MSDRLSAFGRGRAAAYGAAMICRHCQDSGQEPFRMPFFHCCMCEQRGYKQILKQYGSVEAAAKDGWVELTEKAGMARPRPEYKEV